jgi:hypothetical protein
MYRSIEFVGGGWLFPPWAGYLVAIFVSFFGSDGGANQPPPTLCVGPRGSNQRWANQERIRNGVEITPSGIESRDGSRGDQTVGTERQPDNSYAWLGNHAFPTRNQKKELLRGSGPLQYQSQPKATELDQNRQKLSRRIMD